MTGRYRLIEGESSRFGLDARMDLPPRWHRTQRISSVLKGTFAMGRHIQSIRDDSAPERYRTTAQHFGPDHDDTCISEPAPAVEPRASRSANAALLAHPTPSRKQEATVVPQALGKEGQAQVRRATPADAEVCGRICFEAFATLADRHNFPRDFPAPEIPTSVLSRMFSHPAFFCVVAERGGTILGSNCLDERSAIAGVGPVTIDPGAQNRGVGRQLMQAVLDRAAERKFAGIRLVQAAYHNRSLSLYAKLGFVVREPLACMQGPPMQKTLPGYHVRPAQAHDLPGCNDLCLRVHGHDRGAELEDAIRQGTAVVAESDGQLKAYASSIAFFGHAVGESNQDLQALIAAALEFQGPGILIPTRNTGLFHWCLSHGLRVVQPMTLMTMGLYNEPAGAYLPSILF
jgi:predicted N-acetyltransferase YhbS